MIFTKLRGIASYTTESIRFFEDVLEFHKRAAGFQSLDQFSRTLVQK